MEVAAELLSVTVRRDGGGAVVVLRGELDLETAPSLERVLAELVGDDSCSSIVVELHDVVFVSSTGLAVLLRALNHAEAGGGRLVLGRPSAVVMRALELAGLRSTFTIQGEAEATQNDGAAPRRASVHPPSAGS